MSLIKATIQGSLWPLWTGHLALALLGILFVRIAYSELLRKTAALSNSQGELLKSNQELKASQSRLLQSEKMASVGQLAAGVAHEINNPIGYIAGNLRSLQKYLAKFTDFIAAQKTSMDKFPDHPDAEELKALEKKLKLGYLLEDAQDLIDESLDGADRVQTIVKSLKTFSRVDQNAVQSVDLKECIKNSLKILHNELKQQAKIENDYGDVPPVICYPQQLSQAFMNLFINASHAIETQGLIRVRSWADEDHAYVAVSDDGCGIPEENLPHIFEPFFTTKEVGKGTGLGLSMIYDIVKNHHGDISVESELGKGSTFTLKLPLESRQGA